MESDRLEANLGPSIVEEDPPVSTPLKQPRKRFVGRRTVEQNGDNLSPSLNIEDSKAIQGSFAITVLLWMSGLMCSISCSTEKTSKIDTQHPTRDLERQRYQ